MALGCCILHQPDQRPFHSIVGREERLTDAVGVEAFELGNLGREELVWLADENARAVACLLLGAASTPMVQVFQDSNAVLDHLVRGASFEVDNETHTTSVAEGGDERQISRQFA